MVRWNKINGKGGAVGCFVVACTCVYQALRKDAARFNLVFKLSGWYLLAVLFLVTAIHLAFFANPLETSASLKLKEDKAAAAKAAKSK